MAGEGSSELLLTASRLRSGTAGLRQDKVVSDKQIESSVCPLVESALLSTAQVASHLCGLPFKPTENANDILLNIIEKRDPGKLLIPDSSGGSEIRESRSLNTAKRLRENFNPISREVETVDPFVNFLIDNISSSGPTSLRRGQNYRTTIHAGDVVVFEEPNTPGLKVMAAVMGFRAARTNSAGSDVNMQIYATRLYGFHELFRILDRLQAYRASRLQHVDFDSQSPDPDLKDDVDFKAGLAAYTKLKTQLWESFSGFPDEEHKIVHVALSDHTTMISPDNVHDVLRLELSDKTLENVSACGGNLPSPPYISKLLHGTTVVYTHILNTKTWMLRPIVRSELDMVTQILPAVCQSLRTAPPALVNGMLGMLRRQIFTSLKRLAQDPASSERSSVFEPSCTFSLFAYIVYVTQEQDSVSISWKNESRSWEAKFKGPASLEPQLGIGWGNFQLADGPFVQVIPASEVLLCYTHQNPDKLRITLRVTRGQEGGGSVELLPTNSARPL